MSQITADATEARLIRKLVDSGGYTPDEAVAAVRKVHQDSQASRSATEAPEQVPEAIAGDTTPQRANTRRRTPQRDLMPDGATINPLNEKQFTQMVLYVLRAESWTCYHTFDSRKSEPGFPDIVAVHADHGVIFAELKMPRGKVSEAQQRWLDLLQSAGQRVYLWYPKDFDDITAIAKGEGL